MTSWALLPTIITLAGVRANADTEYFPPRAFVLESPPGDRKDISGSLADGFSRHLRAMNEPSLWKSSHGDKGPSTYRFLWLPTWGHPVAVRIERTNNGV